MPPSSLNTASPLEDGLDASRAVNDNGDVEDAEFLSDKDWVKMFKAGLDSSAEFQDNALRSQWSRNYRAFNSKHPNGTKYDTPKYRNRSKLFRPKTRMAVRKNDATAAAALFSTMEVVNITAARATDKVQDMGAHFLHAVLNYRLDRGNEAGPPFFLTCVGAHQDAQVAGICVTKQYWEYEEIEIERIIDVPMKDPATGMPLPRDDGQPGPATQTEMKREKKIIADRLMIDNIPPEQAFIDQTADWRDPIQRGTHFIAGYPVRESDVQTWLNQNISRPRMGGGKWRENIDLSKVRGQGKTEQRNTAGVRRARETQGIDRYESRLKSDDDVLWLYECFYRYDGEDYTWWMLGETILLSDPVPTRDAYPAHKGRRPYVRGVGAVETHKVYPSAPVETWQQLQHEMNENTNLVLDARKMSITPITKVRRGRNIDLKAVQNRGPDATVMVEDKDDIEFDRAPGPDGGAQVDMNNLNVDFDELAGVFSQGSVQTNRQLNETVGGMNLMSQSSNALTEFDLRVWVETWVEPCLRQCVELIQFYEADELIMAVAGEQAGLTMGGTPPKPGIEDRDPEEMAQMPEITLPEIMAEFDDLPVSVRVDVGIGALDSKQKVEKLMAGAKMTMEMAPVLQADGARPDGVGIVKEAWGLLGYKDATRFIKKLTPQEMQPKPDPAMEKARADAAMKQQDAEIKEKQAEADERRKQEEHQRRMAEMDQSAKLQRQGSRDEMNRSLVERGGQPMPDDAGNEEVMAALQQQTQMIVGMMTELTKALTAMNAPKQIVHDAQGRPIGVKPMTMQ